ncbi:hypothetical protein ACH5RR_000407 [Cinchona calisaya]|uniref:Uncharacterized protein n=1 Tax=Cinchona calisaya TaxID=153742 RepID=A0ABD3B0T4_9GENT
MGGGSIMFPEKSTAVTSTTNLHSQIPVSVISSEPSKPAKGISCACHESMDSPLDGIGSGRECKAARKCCSGCVFGSAPSRFEVENAMADLQRFMPGEVKSDFHWHQPIVFPRDSIMLQSPGYGRIHDAFRMLQREPSVQNMVVSISCDKAVWNAILNNNAVKNLQGSLSAGEKMQTFTEEADIANLILKWILGFTKTKVVDMIEKIGLMMAELFLPADKEKPTSELTDLVEEKIRSSLLLSVVIILIVVVTRNYGI